MTRARSFACAIALVAAMVASTVGMRASAGVPQEGIKVHGDWTIVIRNADGSIASRNEFKNALVPVGAGNIAALLTGNLSVGTWLIYFDGAGICQVYQSNCFISTPRYGLQNILASNNLTVTAGAGADYGKVFLTGSLKATGAGTIAQVATLISPCAGNVAAGSCSSSILSDFSQRTLNTAIQVVAGQTVDISVVFSFS
jgi:hypothetical protein